MESDWGAIKQKKTELLEKEVRVFIAKLEKIRSNRINLEMIRGLPVNYQGEKKPIKTIANLRVSANHELIIHAFEPKLLPFIIKTVVDNQLGYKQERTTEDEVYFTLLPMTREIKERLIRNVKVIGEEGKTTLRLIRQKLRDLVKKNKDFSQDQKRNYESQIDQLVESYQDKLSAAEAKKTTELS